MAFAQTGFQAGKGPYNLDVANLNMANAPITLFRSNPLLTSRCFWDAGPKAK